MFLSNFTDLANKYDLNSIATTPAYLAMFYSNTVFSNNKTQPTQWIDPPIPPALSLNIDFSS